MKEMVYKQERKIEVLDTGYMFGYLYFILSLGTHPTAYIKIPSDHPYFNVKDYNKIPLNVHMGLTFMNDDGLILENGDFIEGKFIGWDYAHAGDYYPFLDSKYDVLEDKKWTTKEIQEEVKDACYQLEEVRKRRMNMRKFEFVSRLDNTEGLKLPERSTRNSAGFDFYAINDFEILPYRLGDKPYMIPTGIKVKMPDDEFLMLVNRSSNPAKKNLIIPQGVGIVDSDYYGNPDNDGEMFFAYYNLSDKPVEIKKGEKLGQGIFMKYYVTDDDKADGERVGGWGSTGK